MEYRATAASAQAFAGAGRLEEWVHRFLLGEGDNREFSQGLRLEPRRYEGPVQMKLSQLERCCGPEDGMRFQIPREGFEKVVEAIQRRCQQGDWDMPPLIVGRSGRSLELNDGNHRYEALRRLGEEHCRVILWETL